jgi:hypothetical protein
VSVERLVKINYRKKNLAGSQIEIIKTSIHSDVWGLHLRERDNLFFFKDRLARSNDEKVCIKYL